MTQSGSPSTGQQGNRSLTVASQYTVAQRRNKTADLLAEGKTVRQIAGVTGVSHSTAHKDVQHVLKAQQPTADLTEQRRLAIARLDSLEETLRQRLADQQIEAFDADGEPLNLTGNIERTAQELIRVEERRAKLLGLDAPVRAEVDASVQVNYRVHGADGV